MKKTNLFGALVLLVGIPLIAACDLINSSTSDSTDSNSTNTSQSSSSDSSSSSSSSIDSSSSSSSADSSTSSSTVTSSINPDDIEPGDVYYATFSHTFTASDVQRSGGTTDEINGLVFDYSEFAYLANASGGSGLHIGSGNNPQTTPWTLSTSLPYGTYVLGWSIEVSNGSGGGGIASAEFGDYSYSERFSSYSETTTISDSDLNVASDSFSLTLQSTARSAIYFYNLTIELYNEYGLLEGITSDAIEPSDPVTPGEGNIPSTNYELTDRDTYYADVNLTLEGDALVEELRDLISNMTSLTYGSARYTLQYIDEDLTYTGYERGIWDGDLIVADWGDNLWQREHVWPQSHLNMGDDEASESYTGVASDLHNLRVACSSSNNYHSNKYYANENSSTYFDPSDLEGRLSGVHLYEGDSRGDAARILFYMAVRYDYLELSDNLDTDSEDPDSNYHYSNGLLSVLLDWDRLDPVDDFEIQRNNRIYEYQGNRNPFIDYYDQNLAEAIWG